MSADGDFAVGIDKDRLKIWQLSRRTPVIETDAAGVSSVAMALTRAGTGRTGPRGLLARGGTRLELFDLPSMVLVAAFDADAPFDECAFESLSMIVCKTADDRRHRLRIVRAPVEVS
jgi:hypothetical protein